eukprot:jgi/Ulvmu1/1628/UM113_0005.1
MRRRRHGSALTLLVTCITTITCYLAFLVERNLADAAISEPRGGSDVVAVASPPQLQDAVRSGARHIVITEHLDLRQLSRFAETTFLDSAVLAIVQNRLGQHTSIIRGNCSHAPPEAMAPPSGAPARGAGQCMVVVREDWLEAPLEGSRLWLSNLYVTLPAAPAPPVLPDRNHSTMVSVPGADVYLTGMTFAGDGGEARALDVSGGRRAFLSKSQFFNFDNDEDATIRLEPGARATVVDCTFSRNTIARRGGGRSAYAAGPVIGLRSGLDGTGAAAWFHGCLFLHNVAPTSGEAAVDDRAARVYSTSRQPTVFDRSLLQEIDAWHLAPLEVHESPAQQPDVFAYVTATGRPFLRPSDGFYQQVFEETGTAMADMPSLPASNEYKVLDPYLAPDGTMLTVQSAEDTSSKDTTVGVVVGVCAATLVMLLLLMAVWLLRVWRRRAAHSAQHRVKPADQEIVPDMQVAVPAADEKLQKAGTPPWEPYGSPFAAAAAAASAAHGELAPACSRSSQSDGRTLQLHSLAHPQGSSPMGSPVSSMLPHDVASMPSMRSMHSSLRPDLVVRSFGSAAESAAAQQALQLQLQSRGGSETAEPLTDTGGLSVGTREAPAAGADARERLEFVNHQLDTLAGQDILGSLVLEPGHSNRMHGGQAVIQFAKDRNSGRQYALKFFLSHAAFAGEAALYTDRSSPLGPFLPQLRSIAGAAGHEPPVVDARARPLPPCIVMEKGESLDVWMQRNRDGVDMVTGLQVIQHVAERLADLHAAGYVHRDLKLSNIMWLPRENRWTLIDFGCAARAGESAPLRLSLKYAPPEVVRAVRSGAPAVVASAAMDLWSLGVVAVQLFTGRSVLEMLEGRQRVMAQIVGEEPLPWERGAEGSTELLHALGSFRGPVLGLLRRDPVLRLHASAFARRCRAVLERTTASNTGSVAASHSISRPHVHGRPQ